MMKWFRNILPPINYKFLHLVLVIIASVFALLLVNLSCHQCLEDGWAKICIVYCTILITVVELGDIFQKERSKKLAIFISITALFLVNIWDTTEESIEFKMEAEKRDESIKADSIRATEIINNLGTAIGKIDSSAQNLVKIDSSISLVEGVLDKQVSELTSIVSESKEVQNNITGGDSYIKFFLIKNWKSQTLELHCAVLGRYPMHINDITINNNSSIIESLSEKPVKLEPLVNGSGSNGHFNIKIASLSPNSYTFLVKKYSVADFKKDINLGIMVHSNNGNTFQRIKWINHRLYFSSPPKTMTATLKADIDWSGEDFGYSSHIRKIWPRNNQDPMAVLDDLGDIYYYENYTVQLKLSNANMLMAY